MFDYSILSSIDSSLKAMILTLCEGSYKLNHQYSTTIIDPARIKQDVKTHFQYVYQSQVQQQSNQSNTYHSSNSMSESQSKRTRSGTSLSSSQSSLNERPRINFDNGLSSRMSRMNKKTKHPNPPTFFIDKSLP